MPRTVSLLAALRRQIGAADAGSELRWLRQHAAKKKIPLRPLVERRVAHEPLQYIIGSQPFGDLDLLVRPPVLIPRPETEHWATRLAGLRRPQAAAHRLNVLDICTGSGCIPVLLAHSWPKGSMRALAVDIAPEAVRLARENATHCGAGVASAVRVVQADLFSPTFADLVRERMPGGIDVLTANPPYISASDYAALDRSVRDFEDRRALLADDDGLAFYPRIAELIPTLLKPGGLVAVEVGKGQSDAVVDIFRSRHEVSRTEVWTDPWGVPRTVLAHVQ